MDLLKLLRESFPNISVVQQEAPSYVRCHLKADQSIILAYSKANSYSMTSTTPRKRDQTTLISEFELTGSPLKLDLGYDRLEDTILIDISTHWTQDENVHEPLSLEECRNIVNFYNSKIFSLPPDDCLPLWVVCDAQDKNKTVLLAALSFKEYFARGIVTFMDIIPVSNLSIDKMKQEHWNTYSCSPEQSMTCIVEGIFRVSGKRTKLLNNEDFSKFHNGMTQLECEWTKPSLQVPAHETDVKLVQEIIIGHELSECTPLWKSVCAIQGIRNALLSLTNILTPNNTAEISLKPFNSIITHTQKSLEYKLRELLNEIEDYSVLPHGPKGGCICISDDCTNLQQVFKQYSSTGSSNDFTYKLWDILKECNMVDDLINLLVYALKEIYKRNLRPFIDPGNTSYIGSLVKKLSRGLSQQAIKSLSTFHTNPMRALNVIAQLGIAKTCWEYTNIFSLVDNALGFNDRLRLQNKVSEINEEVLNQTVLDMTLGSGDVTVNPFDTKFNLMDSTFVHEAEPAVCENLADLTLDNFASLKKHNIEIKTERRLPVKDQPLISDDVDIELTSKEWKFKLTRLAQLQICMEHIYRSQLSLNCDFNTLKSIIAQLLDHYTADNSPIKTVDQLNNEPVQIFNLPVPYKIVKDHLQFKHATMYRVTLKSDCYEDLVKGEPPHVYQTIKSTFVYSQQPLFPPSVFSLPDANVAEDNDVLYYASKYTYINNSL